MAAERYAHEIVVTFGESARLLRHEPQGAAGARPTLSASQVARIKAFVAAHGLPSAFSERLGRANVTTGELAQLQKAFVALRPRAVGLEEAIGSPVARLHAVLAGVRRFETASSARISCPKTKH